MYLDDTLFQKSSYFVVIQCLDELDIVWEPWYTENAQHALALVRLCGHRKDNGQLATRSQKLNTDLLSGIRRD